MKEFLEKNISELNSEIKNHKSIAEDKYLSGHHYGQGLHDALIIAKENQVRLLQSLLKNYDLYKKMES